MSKPSANHNASRRKQMGWEFHTIATQTAPFTVFGWSVKFQCGYTHLLRYRPHRSIRFANFTGQQFVVWSVQRVVKDVSLWSWTIINSIRHL